MNFLSFFALCRTKSFFVCTDFNSNSSTVSISKEVKEVGLLSYKLMEMDVPFVIGNSKNSRSFIIDTNKCPKGYKEDLEMEEKLKYKEEVFSKRFKTYVVIICCLLLITFVILSPQFYYISDKLRFAYSFNCFAPPCQSHTIVSAELDDGRIVYKSHVHLKINKHSCLCIRWSDEQEVPVGITLPEIKFARFKTEEQVEVIKMAVNHNIQKDKGSFSFEVEGNKITCEPESFPDNSFLAFNSVYSLFEPILPIICKTEGVKELSDIVNTIYNVLDLNGCCLFSRTKRKKTRVIYMKHVADITDSLIFDLIAKNETDNNDINIWSETIGKYRFWGSSMVFGSITISLVFMCYNTSSVIRGPEYLISQLMTLSLCMISSVIAHASMVHISKLVGQCKSQVSKEEFALENNFFDKVIKFNDKNEIINASKINTNIDLRKLITNKQNYIVKQNNGRPEIIVMHAKGDGFAGCLLQLREERIVSPIALLENSTFMGWLVRVEDSHVMWYFSGAIKTLSELETAISPDDLIPFKEAIKHVKNFSQIKISFKVNIKVDGTYKPYTILLYRTSGDYFVITASDEEEYLVSIKELQLAESTVNLALNSGNITSWNYQKTDFPVRIFYDWNELRNATLINTSTIRSNVLEDYQDKVIDLFNKCLEDGKPFIIDVPILIGTIKWCSMRGIKIDNDTIQILVIDITQIKEAEENLILEKERVQDAVMAKTRFLADMSHEIRNPLNGISGLIELLCDANLPEVFNENIEILTSSFNQLMDLLNDTLDLAKIEQGKMTPSFTNFNPLKEMDEIIAKHRKAKIPLMTQTSPSLPRLLYGDPHFFKRIISNILTNSYKFTKKGRILITIYYEDGKLTVIIDDTGIGISKDIREKIYNIFTMGDSSMTRPYGGIGVGLALCQKMLNLLHGSIDLKSEVGVGSVFTVHFPCEATLVPYVPKLVKERRYQVLMIPCHEQVMGAVRPHADFYGIELVTDEKDCTERLRMIFINDVQEQIDRALKLKKKYPLTRITMIGNTTKKIKDINCIRKPIPLPLLPDLFASITWPKKEESESVKKYVRVLLAEDNLTNQLVMNKMFQKINIEYKIVDNGQEAINALEEKEYGLVFLDQNMPVLDGPSAARAIRSRSESWSNVTIVALTASHSKDDEMLCLDAGMNAFLTKPITFSVIKNTLNKYATKN